MLSRVAENLYWMARYMERAENTARLINVNANLLMDLPQGATAGWGPVIDIMGLSGDFNSRYGEPSEGQVLKFLIGDRKNPGSIISSLESVRENCRTVREILPRQIWEEINDLRGYANLHLDSGLSKRGKQQYLERIIRGSEIFIGVIASLLSRGDAYNFLKIGRNLERADMTTRIIDVRSANPWSDNDTNLKLYEATQWVSVLNSLSASQMYRQQMRSRVKREDVLEFLFRDFYFPRSFIYCINTTEECVGKLKNNKKSLKCLRSIARTVAQTKIQKLEQPALQECIDGLQILLTDFHNTFSDAYFLKSQVEQGQQQTQNI